MSVRNTYVLRMGQNVTSVAKCSVQITYSAVLIVRQDTAENTVTSAQSVVANSVAHISVHALTAKNWSVQQTVTRVKPVIT